MANEVARTEGVRSVAPIVATDATELAERFNGLIERDHRARVDTLPTLPSHAQRSLMQARSVELHGALRPITYADADMVNATTLLRLFLGGYLNLKSDNPEQTARAYVKVYLGDQPLWAIIQACNDFKNHRVYDLDSEGKKIPFTLDYAPSGARMRSQCQKITERFREEQGRLSRVLAITVAKPAERHISTEEATRVREGILALSQRLSSGIVRERAEDQAKRRAEIEAANARTARIMEEARRRNADAEGASQEASLHG